MKIALATLALALVATGASAESVMPNDPTVRWANESGARWTASTRGIFGLMMLDDALDRERKTIAEAAQDWHERQERGELAPR